MRVGYNPASYNNKIETNFYHRVVIPVYIPHFEGYFKDALQIFVYCFQSLYNTVSTGTAITIIDNACCPPVKDYFNQMLAQGKIDQLITNKTNLGKVDPFISVMRGCQEPLITLSDADVLFTNGWLPAVEAVFTNFPKAGIVSPSPSPKGFKNFCNTVLFTHLFSKSLRLRPLLNAEHMTMFLHSIDNMEMYQQRHYEAQLSLQNNLGIAIVGCGHFIITCRTNAFKHSPRNASNLIYGGDSEAYYIDEPADKAGYWRLATVNNYAFHMGNTLEPWMEEFYNKIVVERQASNFSLKKVKPMPLLPYTIKAKLISIIMYRLYIKKIFFTIWGNKKLAQDY